MTSMNDVRIILNRGGWFTPPEVAEALGVPTNAVRDALGALYAKRQAERRPHTFSTGAHGWAYRIDSTRGVAQRSERPSPERRVEGSNPSAPATRTDLVQAELDRLRSNRPESVRAFLGGE